jgi:rhamnosyl/mannosyltransferase
VADGVPHERVHVVPPPISVEEPAVSASGGVPLVLFVGRLFPFKGTHHLVAASGRIAADHHLMIAGDGPARASLQRRCGDEGIEDRVTFVGAVAPDELDALYRQATVVVFPSLLGETFGMTGPEAMARGIPVVAYAQGGVLDWLEHDVNGLAVEPGDIAGLAQAIERVVSEPGLAQRLGRGGLAAVDEWSPRRHAERLDAIYRRVGA